MKELELLAPAGNLATLKAVIHAGADAVYLGGDRFGARAYANNFSQEELLEGIRFGHLHNRKVILAVNTLLKNTELEQELYDYIRPYYEAGIDAVIVQDMGVVSLLKQYFPDLPLHSSTQMTVTNVMGARLLKEQGFERVVTAREMSLVEIERIHKEVGIEIESFIHGALCYCYSGQCLLSSMLGGRSGNRGRCAQPCRLPYTVMDAAGRSISKPETPILSLKDMCTLPFLYEMADRGVYSFKIEGRMKTPEYAAGVVSIYRKYMDSYLSGNRMKVEQKDLEQLASLGNRNGFTEGFYYHHNDSDMLTGAASNHSKHEGSLQEQVREQYVAQEIKEKINGKLILCKDLPAKIQITYRDMSVVATGATVMQALKQPLSRDTVAEKMRKTGNTAFAFDDLSIEMEEDVFLPVNQLNQLRRDALEQLEQALCTPYERVCKQEFDSTEMTTIQKGQRDSELQMHGLTDKRLPLNVLVENRQQLAVVLKYDWVTRIYLDSLCYTKENWGSRLSEDVACIHAKGKEAYYVFPTVFRSRTSDFYEQKLSELSNIKCDGYLIRSLDELAFLKEHKLSGAVMADGNLYSYSNRASAWYYQSGMTQDTIPLELNYKEVRHRANEQSELTIYGRARLMTSAQCIHKNTTGCNKISGITYLKDRYQVVFPVRNNCMECYNIIYNSTPLCLFKEKERLMNVKAKSFRLEFTVEEPEIVEKVMQLCQMHMLNNNGTGELAFLDDYTNGHWKRGVE